MKRPLLFRLLTAYLLFGILGFILISTYTHKSLQNGLINAEAEQLYAECTEIASSYASDFYSSTTELPQLSTQLKTLGKYMHATIQVINTTNRILVDSADESVLSGGSYLEDFNISDFGSRYYRIDDFYGTYHAPQLTVFAPISREYRVRGYVLIHKPLADLLTYSNQLLNISYLTFLMLYLLAFLLLIPFGYFIYRPLQKMSAIAKAYTGGDFSNKINYNRNNELGVLAASLDYMANELNTLEEDQRKFVSNVSHDFRSPLTSIKGYVEAILDGTIPSELQDKYLNIILFETERLNKLTSGLLELNKYGSHGKTILDISNFDVNYIIRMTARTFEGICQEKKLSIELVLSGENLFVTGDMPKIQQVIYNLMDNAIKFSHSNSSIKIETTEKNDKVFVSVKDAGIGIPKDSLGKIWERFYKSDLSRGKDKKGTGLGLSIVKEIIQAHNENINVISTEGVGTEFIFTLPLAKE